MFTSILNLCIRITCTIAELMQQICAFIALLLALRTIISQTRATLFHQLSVLLLFFFKVKSNFEKWSNDCLLCTWSISPNPLINVTSFSLIQIIWFFNWYFLCLYFSTFSCSMFNPHIFNYSLVYLVCWMDFDMNASLNGQQKH